MIELKDVTYGYTDKEVLHNVSVRFDTGGMYAIYGQISSYLCYF